MILRPFRMMKPALVAMTKESRGMPVVNSFPIICSATPPP